MAERVMRQFVVLLAWLSITVPNQAQQPTPTEAVPVDPVVAILDAFRSHGVVALSEGAHGNEQGLAFRLSLIRDSRFADRVNDLVLEGPNARYQDVMDRYVRGDDVPIEVLRRVWDDSTQVQSMWRGEVPETYRAVRQLNMALPQGRQLRILLADPPIDWDQVHTKQDYQKWLALRDTFPAELIEREVLAKHRRALAVFGNMHFQRRQMLANYVAVSDGPAATIVSVLEQSGATKVFSIWTATDTDLRDLQPNVATWSIPSLANLRGTVLGAVDFSTYYPSTQFPLATTRVAVQDGKIVGPIPRDQWRSLKMEDQFDAVLYLGPKSSITVERRPLSPALCSDPEFLPKRLARLALAGLPPIETERLKQLCADSPK